MFQDEAKRDSWEHFILERGVLGFFSEPVTLRSGRVSRWYVNWRDVAEDVWSLQVCVGFLLAFLQECGLAPDTIYGVPEGASKLALFAQARWAEQATGFGPGTHTLAMGRGKVKSHGSSKDRAFLGRPQGKTLLVEDVTTTGDSLLGALEILREQAPEAEVMGALCLTDRGEPRPDGEHLSALLEREGIPFYAMSDVRTLLPRVWSVSPPEASLREAVCEEAAALFGEGYLVQAGMAS